MDTSGSPPADGGNAPKARGTRVPLDMTGKRLPVTVLSLVWPVVLQEAAWSVLSIVITVLLGRLGAVAITAAGLSENIVHLPEIVFAGVSIGATAIVARHVGANEPERANHTLKQALLLAFILGAVFGLVLWFAADQLLWVFRAKPDVAALGRDYIRINAPCSVFFFVLYGGEAVMRGTGDTRTPMLITLFVEAIGTILAFLLIRGAGPIPALGVLGAGIARAISSVIGAIVVLVLLVRGRGVLKYNIRDAFKFDLPEMKRIFNIGLPAFAEQLQMRIAMSIYTIIISSLGTTVYAAHSLAMRVEEFAFMPAWGFSIATTTLVGQYLGAKQPELAQKAGYLAQRYCLIAMVTLGLITFFLGHILIDLFIDDAEVIRIGSTGLKVWAFAMPGMAINQSLAGGLRGAGDTRWVLLLSTIGMWTMRVGGGALMVYAFNLGPVGAWTGAVLDHTVRAVLIRWRFSRGKWKTIKV